MATTPTFGMVLYSHFNIWPVIPVSAPNGALTLLAGEVGGAPTWADPKFYYMCPHDRENGDTIGGQFMGQFWFHNTVGAATLLAQYTDIHFVPNPLGTKNDFFARAAFDGEEIHGIVLVAATNADVGVHILLFMYPYITMGCCDEDDSGVPI